MFGLTKILRFLILLFPSFFVFSSFMPLREYFQFLYIGKHFVMLMIFSLVLVLGNTKYLKYFVRIALIYAIFVVYVFYNSLFISNYSFASLYFIYSLVAIFIITTKINFIFKENEVLKLIYWGLLISLFLSIFYSVLWGTELFKLDYTPTGRRLRWYFDFHNPAYLSSMLLLLGIIQIYFKKLDNINWPHFLILFPLNFGLILLTDTRSGIISLALFYIFLNFSKITRIGKIALLISSPFILYALSLNFDLINGISSSRLTVWVDTFNHNIDLNNLNHLFFGIGLGNAKDIGFYKTFDADVEIYKEVFHADNYYLETIIQFGLIGFIILVSLLLLIYRKINSGIHSKKNKEILNALYIIIVLYGFFNSSFLALGSALSIGLWILFWQHYFLSFKAISYRK